jgi:hypothetical protein
MFGRKKLFVEKVEDEFKTKKMRDRKVFFDLNIRAQDPEEVRAHSTELMTDIEFQPVLSELTKFEDVEFEGVFRGGRLKPIKFVTKAVKERKKGPRFPLLYKLLAIIGLGCLFVALLRDFIMIGIDPNSFIIVATLSLILAVIFYSVKKVVPMALWLKIVGIYDVESNKSDLKMIISSDLLKADKETAKKLEEDVTELFHALSDRYVRKAKKVTPIIVKKKAESSEGKIVKEIKSVEDEMAKLSSRLASGDISETTFKEAKANLEKRKDKLETILDLITTVGSA